MDLKFSKVGLNNHTGGYAKVSNLLLNADITINRYGKRNANTTITASRFRSTVEVRFRILWMRISFTNLDSHFKLYALEQPNEQIS